MNPKYGTKWFTFYTKVRPWLACISALVVIIDFVQYTSIYAQYWWMMLYFIVSLIQAALSVAVAIKSYGDYREFVHFVKLVLLFDTFGLSYQNGVTGYINSSLDMMSAIIYGIVALIIFYFVWYRLNVKYFKKRLLNVSQSNEASGLSTSQSYMTEFEYAKHQADLRAEETSASSDEPLITQTSKNAPPISNRLAHQKAKQRYCKFCGCAIDPCTKQCTGCGKQYFKVHRRRGSAAIIILAIIAVTAVAFNVCQFTRYQQEIAELGEKITKLEEKVASKSDDISKLNSRITVLQTEAASLRAKVSFYDEYVVFVSDDGTRHYHKYGCIEFDDSCFWAYNIAAAESKGFSPCSYCCD